MSGSECGCASRQRVGKRMRGDVKDRGGLRQAMLSLPSISRLNATTLEWT